MSENLEIITVSDIPVQPVKWLWYPFIPKGKLSLLQGDPGEGKTTLVLTIIAALTTGTPLPGEDDPPAPSHVIYQTAEDGVGDTIRPRLENAHADTDLVHIISEKDSPLSLSDERITQSIQKLDAKLLVIDPLQAYLGADVDMNRANEVRPVLQKLSRVAEDTGCAILLIGHMNKMEYGKSLYRGLGSVDIPAACRSVLLLTHSPKEPGIRYLYQVKSTFTPKSVCLPMSMDDGIQFLPFVDLAEEVFPEETHPPHKPVATKKDAADSLLKSMLSDGPVPAKTVMARLLEEGISERTAKYAKLRAGIGSKRVGDCWYWELVPDTT